LPASVRAIGEVKDRAAGVVKAVDRAVGRDGTLLLNLGARDEKRNVVRMRHYVDTVKNGEEGIRLARAQRR
jgi:hypothetical protein